MIQRLFSTLLGVTALLVGIPLAFGDTVQLVPVDRNLQARDLANLAEAVGLRFEIFDYDTVEPHCVHFFVDEVDGSGAITRHDGHGQCGLAGPQRLTIQWKAEAGQVDFRFIRFRRDIEQGGSVSGPTISIPESAGLTEYGIVPPELSFGRETVLFHGAYGWNEGPRMEFKVLAELRRNPNGVIGTE